MSNYYLQSTVTDSTDNDWPIFCNPFWSTMLQQNALWVVNKHAPHGAIRMKDKLRFFIDKHTEYIIMYSL